MKCVIVFLTFAVLGCFSETIQKSDDVLLSEVLQGIQKLDEYGHNYTVEFLIESNGYPVETHRVITSDGYILKLHRIPRGKTGRNNGRVAFVQHGILSSSADWCILGSGKGLPFILADYGYDVWLGNARGNTWCCEHETLTRDDPEFWRFSWHEIGTIDVPTMIDYVLEQTGQSGVYYVGHSQGTTVYYVMTSTRPEYNRKIKVSVSLAPIAFMSHMTSPLLHIISYWTGTLDMLTSIIGMNEFLPNNNLMKYIIGDGVCKEDSITQLLCTNTLFAICGFSRAEMNTSLLPIMTKYTPAGASTKQMVHYGQEISSGHFRQFDYGLLGNLEAYRSITPPNYDLSRITATSYLIYSKNDWLSAETDVSKLCQGMGAACRGKFVLSDYSFNHLDYLFGIDAPTEVYDKVVSLFARH